MEPIVQRSNSAHLLQDSPQTSQAGASVSADDAKTYHATREWGKRGMTFQELMRAFDAFNEAEERVAIGFAWSEDFSKKLEEPLRGVKTVFSDLDGLRPLCPISGASSSSSSSSTTPTSSYKPSTLRRASVSIPLDDFGVCCHNYMDNDHASSSPCANGGETRELHARADSNTIKPAHKRRRSLSVLSSPGTPSVPSEELESREDVPVRPSSRLGFFDEEIGEDDIFGRW